MTDAKLYLLRLRALDLKIKQLTEEIDRLRSEATGLKSMQIRDDIVQHSASGDAMANAVIRIVDLEQQVSEKCQRYADMRTEIIDQIQSLDDPRYVEVLYLRYVRYMRMEEIACVMHKPNGASYSYQHILRLHGEALQKFSKCYGNAISMCVIR
jgi:hypothetical protein